jgi:hypothetical protein
LDASPSFLDGFSESVIRLGIVATPATQKGDQILGDFARTRRVRLVDFDAPDNNDWLVVNQFTVVEGQHHRRADVVVFVNRLQARIGSLTANWEWFKPWRTRPLCRSTTKAASVG